VSGKPVEVILLDTMGELSSAYALGTFSFVGGSMENIGGHNPLEPAAHKVMVLFGPYSSNVQTVVDDLFSKGGLIMVRNEEELARNIIKLAENPDECLARGTRAFEVWKNNSGATNKILPIIEKYFLEEEAYKDKATTA
ncbi:MAG: 3-deoxy-D-manno-octulosonic acid transferase, partial [Proteobacteria bacterium]|nr:3-deoxy-D-manno-octulosonic acid transferase [Pseudomonadota bacterium]